MTYLSDPWHEEFWLSYPVSMLLILPNRSARLGSLLSHCRAMVIHVCMSWRTLPQSREVAYLSLLRSLARSSSLECTGSTVDDCLLLARAGRLTRASCALRAAWLPWSLLLPHVVLMACEPILLCFCLYSSSSGSNVLLLC